MTPAAQIRPAQRAEAPALGAILSDWIDETPWMPRLHSRAEDAGFVARMIDSHQVWTAWQGAQPCGFAARQGDALDALYLRSEARGQGVGTALLRAAQQGQARLTLWCFTANTGAARFYRRAGFTLSRETDGDNAEGLPDQFYVWTARSKEEPAT